MKAEAVIFRCDANARIGIGHVMRCVALAQACQERGRQVVFAVRELPMQLETRIRGEGFEVVRVGAEASKEDARITLELARDRGAEWIAVDGDAFEGEFLRSLQRAGLHILLLDDFARRRTFPADVILNPNLGATESLYQGQTSAALLVGSPYVPLRREFIAGRDDRMFPERARKVLVSLGGSDPENLAPRIAATLGERGDLNVSIVAGPSYEHWEELQSAAGRNVQTLQDPLGIAQLIAESDLAITAAGGTLCELLYSRCPVLSYWRNPVQGRVVRSVAEQGAAYDLGDVGDFSSSMLVESMEKVAADSALRVSMAECGRTLVDGRGAQRVAEAMHSLR